MRNCAYKLNVPRLHHQGFKPEWDGVSYTQGVDVRSVSELAGGLTAHRLKADAGSFAKFLELLGVAGMYKAGAAPLEWEGRR